MSESVLYEWNWQTSFNFTLHEGDQHAPGSPPQAQDGHDHDITEHSDHLHLSSPLVPTTQLDHPDEDMDCRSDFSSPSTSTSEDYDHRIRDMNRLASLERNYYSTFFCCALKLPSFHALLEHIERVHVTVIHGMRYYRPVGAIAGTTLATSTYQHSHDGDDDMEEETSQGWQWPWYSPGEFMFGKEPQIDLGLESDEDSPGVSPPSSSTEVLASLTPTPTPTASTSSSSTTTSTSISPSTLNAAVPTNAALPSPSPRSPIPPLSLSIPVCSGARPNTNTRVRGIVDDSDSDNDSDSLNASTPSLSPSASPSRSPSPSPSPSPTTPTTSISPVSLMGTTSLLLPTPPLSPSSAGMNTRYSELEEWKVSKSHVSYHTHPHAHAHVHSYPNPHSHKFSPHNKKHTHGHGHQRRKMKAHHGHNRDEGRYRYRCPTVGCVKAYLNPNGLKYHREKGKCAFQ